MLIFKGFAVLWYVCAHCVMLCLKVMNDTKYVIFTDLQRGITQLVNMLEASKFHRNVNRIFFFPSDQITIPALTSGANVNLKKKRHNQHHRNRDKMRAIPNLPYARTAATVYGAQFCLRLHCQTLSGLPRAQRAAPPEA